LQQVVAPRLGVQAAVNEQVGLVQEHHLRRLGQDVVHVLRPFHDRVHGDLVSTDLPGQVGVVGGGGNDLQFRSGSGRGEEQQKGQDFGSHGTSPSVAISNFQISNFQI